MSIIFWRHTHTDRQTFSKNDQIVFTTSTCKCIKNRMSKFFTNLVLSSYVYRKKYKRINQQICLFYLISFIILVNNVLLLLFYSRLVFAYDLNKYSLEEYKKTTISSFLSKFYFLFIRNIFFFFYYFFFHLKIKEKI